METSPLILFQTCYHFPRRRFSINRTGNRFLTGETNSWRWTGPTFANTGQTWGTPRLKIWIPFVGLENQNPSLYTVGVPTLFAKCSKKDGAPSFFMILTKSKSRHGRPGRLYLTAFKQPHPFYPAECEQFCQSELEMRVQERRNQSPVCQIRRRNSNHCRRPHMSLLLDTRSSLNKT